MLLFEETPNENHRPKKPELITVAAYLDEEHAKMLAVIQAAGQLNKSEAVRQCVRLGYRTLQARKAKGGAA